jgi:hypothetical protein
MRPSEQLTVGDVYTRQQLRELFGIVDATLNTGVFPYRGHDSVWLFVTESKVAGQPDYRDFIEGDLLHWDGQTAGRTDNLIIGHAKQGIELLLFFRKKRNEFPNSGFRYMGAVEYVSHYGEKPCHFTLRLLTPP